MNEENRGPARALRVQNLSFAYPGVPVFDDVSFSVPRDGLTQVVGPNGGGKTTLARLALGLLKPQRGLIDVLGLPPTGARRSIGYVPQHTLYDPHFPALAVDVVMTGRLTRPVGMFRRQDRDAALQAIENLGLSELASRGFADLSGGQRQRVLLARALVSDPSLLILDEPTANIDRESAVRLEELILAQKTGRAILLITHDFDFLASSVDRVLCVNRNAHIHERRHLSDIDLQRLFTGHFHALAESEHA